MAHSGFAEQHHAVSTRRCLDLPGLPELSMSQAAGGQMVLASSAWLARRAAEAAAVLCDWQ